jgi:hypothetical protein
VSTISLLINTKCTVSKPRFDLIKDWCHLILGRPTWRRINRTTTRHPTVQVFATFAFIILQQSDNDTQRNAWVPSAPEQLRRSLPDLAISTIIGLCSFVYLTGGKILNPSHNLWLFGIDSDANFIGWQFFRRTPILQFPIGNSPNLGTGFASSVVYTDSIPLLAIPFKFLNFLLPNAFQYFGLWVLVCFVLQTIFAFRLLKHWVDDRTSAHLASIFFVIAPCFLHRFSVGANGHLALCAQFFLLWAMHLLLQPQHSQRTWLLLCSASLLVHVYLFSMVFALFVVSVATHRIVNIRGRLNSLIQSALQIGSVLTASIGIFWFVGGFMSAGSDGGDAFIGSGLLALFDPKESIHTFSWSSFFPDIESANKLNQNVSFLGAATLVLMPLSLVFLIRTRKSFNLRRIALILSAILLFALSLSPDIWIASRKLVSYNPPPVLAQVFQSFRTVDRYSWVLVYLLMTIAFASLTFFIRKQWLRVAFLLLLLGIQFFDMRTSISETRERFTVSSYQSPLVSPLWDKLGRQYKRLETVPPLNFDPHWFDFALYADSLGLSSNAAGMARVSDEDFAALVAKQQSEINRLQFRLDTLYVFTNYPPNPMSEEILRRFGTSNFEQSGVRAAEIDGFVVVAP